jgi:hypothetical protein
VCVCVCVRASGVHSKVAVHVPTAAKKPEAQLVTQLLPTRDDAALHGANALCCGTAPSSVSPQSKAAHISEPIHAP